MKYKKVVDSFFLCFAIIALCAPGISEDKIVDSIWAATPVEIDGLNDEWEGDTFALLFNSWVRIEMVTYEFRIPLKKGEGQLVGIGTEPGKILKIGFEWGGLTEELKKEEMARLEGKSTPLYSIRRGAKKYLFWADVKLAQNQ